VAAICPGAGFDAAPALSGLARALLVLALAAGCSDDGGNDDAGGFSLVQSFVYSETGDCSAFPELPDPAAISAFGQCIGSSFTFGDAKFTFDSPDKDGAWSDHSNCTPKLDSGKVECVTGAKYTIKIDCNGCQGTIQVGL